MAWSVEEFSEKLAKIRHLMQQQNVDGVLVGQQVNLFWLTGARPYVNMFGDKGCFDILVTHENAYLVSNNIELARLQQEELQQLNLESLQYNWWDGDISRLVEQVKPAAVIVTEAGLAGFSSLRYTLCTPEVERYRDTSLSVAKAVEQAALQIEIGQSEQEIANLIRQNCNRYGVSAFVTLVGTDERIFKYRHPLPTEKKLERYALLAVSGRKHGLYASITRMVHFGQPSPEIMQKHQAVQAVDAAFILSTQVGASVAQAFQAGITAYAANGYAEQWQYHHQGGLAGYQSREFRGTANCPEIIQAQQVFAWNPTIAGAKSEDTVLITEQGPEILTKSSFYPSRIVEFGDKSIARADILIR